MATAGLLWAATETLTPDALVTQTNFTGAVSTIQTDDTTWMTGCGTNCSQELLVDFPTATDNLTTTANAQSFSVIARNTGEASAPTLTLDVYNNSSAYQTAIASSAISSATGQTVSGTWTATGLGAGPTVQARVTCAPGGGTPSGRASCELDYVMWSGGR